MLSLVFVIFHLFLIYYSDALNCNGRHLDYQDFSIQPIMIWDLDTSKNSLIQSSIASDFKRNVSRLIDSLGKNSGFRCLLNYAGSQCAKGQHNVPETNPPDPRQLGQWMRTFWDSDVLQLGDEFRSQALSLFVNPPKVLKEYNINATSSSKADALSVLEQAKEDATRKDGDEDKGTHFVYWPVLITDKGPSEAVGITSRALISKLASDYHHVTVLTLKNAEAASQWKLVREDEKLPTDQSIRGFWGIFNVPLLQNFKRRLSEYPVLKDVFAEMNDALCSILKDKQDRTIQKLLNAGGVKKLLTDNGVQKLLIDGDFQKLLGLKSFQKLFSDKDGQELFTDKGFQKLLTDGDSQKLLADKGVQKFFVDGHFEKLLPDIQELLHDSGVKLKLLGGGKTEDENDA